MSQLELVQGLYRAFAARDSSAIAALLDPDVVWVQNQGFPGGGTWRGVESITTNVFERLRREFTGWSTQVREWLDAGDHVVAIGDYAGTSVATGRSFVAAFAHVVEVRGGRIVRFRQFTDTAMVVAALAGGAVSSTREG